MHLTETTCYHVAAEIGPWIENSPSFVVVLLKAPLDDYATEPEPEPEPAGTGAPEAPMMEPVAPLVAEGFAAEKSVEPSVGGGIGDLIEPAVLVVAEGFAAENSIGRVAAAAAAACVVGTKGWIELAGLVDSEVGSAADFDLIATVVGVGVAAVIFLQAAVHSYYFAPL